MPFLGAYSLTLEVASQATFGSQKPFFFLPVTREASNLTMETTPGAVFGSLEPFLEPFPTAI